MAKKQNDSGGNALQALKFAIKEKTLDRCYVFHGEEIFLLHHYLGQIKKLLIDELTESFNFHRLTNETFDVDSYADSVENLPMMAESTMVQVDDVDLFKLTEAEREKIQQVLEDIPEYCTVIFTYETATWKPDKRQKKFWDAICKNVIIVEFPKQEQRDLVAWITRHFMAKQKKISTDLCVYLIDITGGTMTALGTEIQKVCAYSGTDVIKKTDIDAVVEPVMDAVVFQMTDLISQGRYGGAMEKLAQLLKMQEEPLLILGAIGGHFRRLSTARTLLDNGKSYSDLMKLCGIGDYPARKAMETARRFSAEYLAAASRLILETDLHLKTSYDEPQRLLEMLLLNLAQEARRD